MENILKKIGAATRIRVETEKKQLSLGELQSRIAELPKPLPFAKIFQEKGLKIIAEVKFASPSAGRIADGDPVAIAGSYRENGASAVSVLTEPQFFQGSPAYLQQIRQKFADLPLLRKDFIIDPWQIFQSRVLGADAVLLIVGLLEKEELSEMLALSSELGLAALTEVHDSAEMEIAHQCGATLIGVNNRNLQNLQISLKTSEELIRYKTPEITMISESGLKTKEELLQLQEKGYAGFLIGTSFMKSGNPGQALRNFLQ